LRAPSISRATEELPGWSKSLSTPASAGPKSRAAARIPDLQRLGDAFRGDPAFRLFGGERHLSVGMPKRLQESVPPPWTERGRARESVKS
jgi:hypothetical protein